MYFILKPKDSTYFIVQTALKVYSRSTTIKVTDWASSKKSGNQHNRTLFLGNLIIVLGSATISHVHYV